jgi:uncharacterized membrane protein YfcA
MPLFELLGYLSLGAAAGLMAGLLGVGGGAIMVPALIFLFAHFQTATDWIPHLAVATSLASVIGTGMMATWAHQRRGGVRWAAFARLAPGMVLGAWLGAFLAAGVPGVWLQRLFGVFLLYTGVSLWRPAPAPPASARALGSGWLLPAAGGGIGALSALLGIGGGSLTVPLLARLGVPLRVAVGTSSACGVPIALFGAMGFVWSGLGRDGLPPQSLGFVYWPAVLALLLGSLPLAPVGAALAHRLPTRVLRRLFGTLMIIISVRLLLAGSA